MLFSFLSSSQSNSLSPNPGRGEVSVESGMTKWPKSFQKWNSSHNNSQYISPDFIQITLEEKK